MAHVLCAWERRARDAANANQESRVDNGNQAFDEHATGGDLISCRPAV
jgi:hypothetical protein